MNQTVFCVINMCSHIGNSTVHIYNMLYLHEDLSFLGYWYQPVGLLIVVKMFIFSQARF